MFNRIYELPLSKDYVRHWGVVEAVRELFQNALDSDSPFEYVIGVNSLQISSRFSKLEPKTLLLGTTSKADCKDKIGSFGEGYKIALLVLSREGRSVSILNGDRVWTPEFRYSNQYEDEILCIKESKYPAGRGKGLVFVINDLSQSELEQIKSTNMHMWDKIGQIIETSYGRILIEHPGKLFVNGLFVCDTELKYGYDVKPEFLKLERDRQTVSSFDLKFLAKDMWFETAQFEKIAFMISEEYPDMSYANYGTPALVKEACYQLFMDQYPGSIVASSQTELKQMVERGMQKVVYIGSSPYSESIRSSASYSNIVMPTLKSPSEKMDEWFKENRGHMRREAIVAFKVLLEESQKWKLK